MMGQAGRSQFESAGEGVIPRVGQRTFLGPKGGPIRFEGSVGGQGGGCRYNLTRSHKGQMCLVDGKRERAFKELA